MARGNSSGDAAPACATVKDVVEASISSLGTLLDKYHVDIYIAGHIHSYSATWPIFGNAVENKSYLDPHGTVHVVEGNGGVPGAHQHSKLVNCSKNNPRTTRAPVGFFRQCGLGMNYGRLISTNASVLTYEHVDNGNDHVTDAWSIVKTHTTVQ